MIAKYQNFSDAATHCNLPQWTWDDWGCCYRMSIALTDTGMRYCQHSFARIKEGWLVQGGYDIIHDFLLPYKVTAWKLSRFVLTLCCNSMNWSHEAAYFAALTKFLALRSVPCTRVRMFEQKLECITVVVLPSVGCFAPTSSLFSLVELLRCRDSII